MEYLLIVNGLSSAYLYVQEAWLRGMRPILLYPHTYLEIYSKKFKELVGDDAEYMYLEGEPEDDPVVESLRGYNIKCVVAGSEAGVRYADRIAAMLGLKCNDPETIWKRNTKKGMHQSLKEAGIRHIKSIAIENEDDIYKFWKENNLKKAMVKHSESMSSIGNKVVHSPEEAAEHYNYLKNIPNRFDVKTDVLMQEFIEGEEYIVNTVSCEGNHTVTDIWKYSKIITESNDVLYNSTDLITNLDGEMYELVKYAYKVLDATGFVYGPCHGEYKIDDKGPVLIETNARPMGFHLKREYLDECLGHHISDIVVDSYLNQKRFEQYRLKPYRPSKYATIKTFINYDEGDANIKPLEIILGQLKSYRHMTTIRDEIIHVPKTIDLTTTPMIVKLCNKDKSILDKETCLLNTIEKYPELACEYEKESKTVPVEIDLKELFGYIARERKTLVVTNEYRHSVWFGKIEDVDNKWDSYDVLIYAYTEGKKLSEIYKSFLRDAAMVRDGGTIMVIPEFKEKVPYGSIGVQMLLQLSGCSLNMPLMGLENYMIATKFGC